MQGRRWLAASLALLAMIPALIALACAWIELDTWMENRTPAAGASGTIGLTQRTSHVSLAVPGIDAVWMEPWQLAVIAGAVAGLGFAGAWALQHGDDRER